jgi:hypothetical protein
MDCMLVSSLPSMIKKQDLFLDPVMLNLLVHTDPPTLGTGQCRVMELKHASRYLLTRLR